ncbi:hypothetical protein FHE72_20420 [Rossellomorea vietnamensis]|uniref:Uncharacterized protein n=1 Tax=Rossellomorea vietnamensis TaxID=218284 RepID=A0A6I6UVX0_9BACI|nr:hypothetical protein [Rossellomorea vietnamensis]QHE63106.1 hypothetical protein FHE72_20420 [Rossellomorea vietnamensis]
MSQHEHKEDVEEQKTRKISARLKEDYVEAIDEEARQNRWTRTQMIDFILEERYGQSAGFENRYSKNILGRVRAI